jgi:hypothetical protein
MPALTHEEEILMLEERVDMYATRAENLEKILMELVVSIELGLDIRQSAKMQRLVDEAKSVIEGEFEE